MLRNSLSAFLSGRVKGFGTLFSLPWRRDEREGEIRRLSNAGHKKIGDYMGIDMDVFLCHLSIVSMVCSKGDYLFP